MNLGQSRSLVRVPVQHCTVIILERLPETSNDLDARRIGSIRFQELRCMTSSTIRRHNMMRELKQNLLIRPVSRMERQRWPRRFKVNEVDRKLPCTHDLSQDLRL